MPGPASGMTVQFSPPDLEAVLPWLVSHLEVEDRRAYLAMLERTVPVDRLQSMLGMIQRGVSPEVWQSVER
jgi:hypothetical protein